MNLLKTIRGNKTIANGALFSAFSFINRGISFLLILIMANFMPPADYGYLNMFNTIVMVVGFFVAFSSEGYLTVSYFRDGVSKVGECITSVLLTGVTVTSILLCVSLLFGSFLERALNVSYNLIIVALFVAFFTVLTNFNLDYIRLKEQVFKYGLYSCGNALLNFVISILLVRTMAYGWTGRVYAQVLCCTVFAIICIIFVLRNNFLKLPSWEYYKSMLLWGIPIIPHLATNFIRQGCDRYIINSTHTIDDVGLFSFALNLVNIVVMIGMGFNQSYSVDVYRVLGSDSISGHEKINKLSKQRKILSLIYLSCTVVIILITYFMIPWVLPKYSFSLNYFLILSIFGFFSCVYFLYTNYLFYFKKTRTIMYITFFTSLLHFVLSLLLTRYSLYCTCAIYCVTQILIVLFIRYNAMKELKNLLYEFNC